SHSAPSTPSLHDALPILLDPHHELVGRTGATVTPEAVVIGTDGVIVYRGRIDNLYVEPGKKRSSATRHDLREALESIQAGHPMRSEEHTSELQSPYDLVC